MAPPLASESAAEPSDDASLPRDEAAFELREATPEEMATPIIFEQDSISLDGLYSDQPTTASPRTLPIAPVPPVADADLHGFLEHFDPGNFLGGWAGDHNDPKCRSLRVAALVDGREVAVAIADTDRPDTPHGGFSIPFADPQVPGLILDGRLTLQVSRPGVEPVVLPMLSSVIEQARSYLPPVVRQEMPNRIIAPPPVEKAVAPVSASPELSYFPIPVGFVSPDQAVVAGRKGFVFRYGDLAAQYAADPQKDQAVQRDAAKWFAAFRARQAALAERGIVYIQTMMPDKATVLNDLAPPGLGPITARLAVLEAMIDTVLRRDGPEAVAWYRSLLGPLRGFHAAGAMPFLRFDSGLRTAATQLVFYQFIQKLAALLPDRIAELTNIAALCGALNPGEESEVFTGDLGAHFGFPLYESEKLPDLTKLATFLIGTPAIARMPRQGDVGTRLMWRNANAPSSLKVVAFGSSFFGRGGGARNLSWWCKSMFAEFHFVWSSELDLAYIDQYKPDVVICQGVEGGMLAPPGW